MLTEKRIDALLGLSTEDLSGTKEFKNFVDANPPAKFSAVLADPSGVAGKAAKKFLAHLKAEKKAYKNAKV